MAHDQDKERGKSAQAKDHDKGKSAAKSGFRSITIPAGSRESERVPIQPDQGLVVKGWVSDAQNRKVRKPAGGLSIAEDTGGAFVMLQQPADQDLRVQVKVVAADDDDDEA